MNSDSQIIKSVISRQLIKLRQDLHYKNAKEFFNALDFNEIRYEAYKHYENEESLPPLNILMKIANFAKVDLNYFIDADRKLIDYTDGKYLEADKKAFVEEIQRLKDDKELLLQVLERLQKGITLKS